MSIFHFIVDSTALPCLCKRMAVCLTNDHIIKGRDTSKHMPTAWKIFFNLILKITFHSGIKVTKILENLTKYLTPLLLCNKHCDNCQFLSHMCLCLKRSSKRPAKVGDACGADKAHCWSRSVPISFCLVGIMKLQSKQTKQTKCH